MACVIKCYYDNKLEPEKKKLEKEVIDNILMQELQKAYRQGIGLHTEDDLKPDPVRSLISLFYPYYKDYEYLNYKQYKKDYIYFDKTINSGKKAKFAIRSKYKKFWMRTFERTDTCIINGERAEVSPTSVN